MEDPPAVPIINDMKEKRRVLAWIPPVIWALIILVSSVIPGGALPDVKIDYLDKVVHFLMYIILALLMVRGYFYNFSNNIPPKVILFMLILGGGYGILMELVQCYIPGREASLLDAVSNIAGILAGSILGKGVIWQK